MLQYIKSYNLGVELLVCGVVDKESPGGGRDVVVLILSSHNLSRGHIHS